MYMLSSSNKGDNMKFCPKCKESKETTEFYKNKQTKDGLKCWCKKCHNVGRKPGSTNRPGYTKDPEVRIRKRQYYKNNKEKVLENNSKWRQTLQGRLLSYKRGASSRNISFDLTIEEFESFWQKPCTYCLSEIKTIGIDRIDSLIGYQVLNCIPCCTICNRMKMAMTQEEFKTQIRKIYDNYCRR